MFSFFDHLPLLCCYRRRRDEGDTSTKTTQQTVAALFFYNLDKTRQKTGSMTSSFLLFVLFLLINIHVFHICAQNIGSCLVDLVSGESAVR